MKDDSLMKIVRNVLFRTLDKAKNISESERKFAKQCIMQENDKALLRYFLTGSLKIQTIKRNDLERVFNTFNESTKEKLIEQINKIIPLSEVTDEEKAMLKRYAERKANDAATFTAKHGGDAMAAVGKQMMQAGHPEGMKTMFQGKAIASLARIYDFLKDVGDRTGATGIMQKISDLPGGHDAAAGGFGALALATLLIYGAHQMYKKTLDNGTKTCSSLSGSRKTECLARFRKKAKLKKLDELRRSVSGCKNSTNPKECIQIINDKIAKIVR